jgi:hypothetical protein
MRIVALFLLLAGTAAQAQPAAPPPPNGWQQLPGFHRHDGFFLRIMPGLAWVSAKSEGGIELRGLGFTGSVQLGGAVAENLILMALTYNDITVGPQVLVNGEDAGDAEDAQSGAVGIGAGVTYYVMPQNLYVSGAITASFIQIDQGGSSGRTEFGPGVRLMVGKEWWVSSDWGLGLAATLNLATMKDRDTTSTRWNTWSIGLAFSATYN